MIDETDIREQIAAFLAGDLDERASDSVQARIDAEPWVARLADEMADLLVDLGRVDDVEPRAGFEDRLREGLAAEIGRPVAEPVVDPRVLQATGAAAATGWADAARPPSRSDARRPGGGPGRGHGRRQGRLRDALAVAAVFALLALVGVAALTRGGGFGSSDDSADSGVAEFADADQDEIAQEDAAQDDSADAATDGGEGAEATALGSEDDISAAILSDPAAEEDADGFAAPAPTEEADDAAATTEAATATTPGGPVLLVLGPVAGEDAAIGSAVSDQDALGSVLGTPVGEAVERAAAFRDELLRGPAFADGTAAGTCLEQTLEAAGPDLVPVVAARLDLPDGPAVAYALVRSAGGQVLDAVDVWVLDVPGCGIDRVVQGDGGR